MKLDYAQTWRDYQEESQCRIKGFWKPMLIRHAGTPSAAALLLERYRNNIKKYHGTFAYFVALGPLMLQRKLLPGTAILFADVWAAIGLMDNIIDEDKIKNVERFLGFAFKALMGDPTAAKNYHVDTTERIVLSVFTELYWDYHRKGIDLRECEHVFTRLAESAVQERASKTYPEFLRAMLDVSLYCCEMNYQLYLQAERTAEDTELRTFFIKVGTIANLGDNFTDFREDCQDLKLTQRVSGWLLLCKETAMRLGNLWWFLRQRGISANEFRVATRQVRYNFL